MYCSDFVARFTDYFDGLASSEEAEAIQSHSKECSSCRRYQAVFEKGASLLRALPEPELAEDFEPRLRHRLYHVADERVLADHSASGATALTVLGVAVLLTAVAWSPVLTENAPVVELAPIVVDRAPVSTRRRTAAQTSTSRPAPALAILERGLWDGARLYEYSPLSQRYRREGSMRQVGLERDR
jgi:anti-sigma factor RsiW